MIDGDLIMIGHNQTNKTRNESEGTYALLQIALDWAVNRKFAMPFLHVYGLTQFKRAATQSKHLMSIIKRIDWRRSPRCLTNGEQKVYQCDSPEAADVQS